jgi:hypothetical protein
VGDSAFGQLCEWLDRTLTEIEHEALRTLFFDGQNL